VRRSVRPVRGRGSRLRVGVLELLSAAGRPHPRRHAPRHWIARQYASITPQAVSVWCRQLGHETFYATYYGQADPAALLPDDLDVVFVATYTAAAPLANALAKRWRRAGTLTVIGGPHAKGFPDDCLRFFDVVVGECDRTLIADIVRERPRGERATTGRPLTDVPSIEERLPEIRTASFWRGRPHPYVVIGVLSSVGCPYRCDFCTDWDTDYALLPLDRLAADIRFVSATIPMVKVAFHDPNFGVKFDPVMATIERLQGESSVRYMIEASLSVLRDVRLARLRDTGCWYVATGVESWADYSNKTAAATVGPRKLERVLAHFASIREHVPVLQANFIFGIDEDRGEAPSELTREFIRRAPFVWPNLTVPTPFGGTPLYDRHRRQGRILETMPLAFYNTPYLVTTPAHYGPSEYYERLIAVLEELTTPATLRARLNPRRGTLAAIDALRILGIRRALREYRTISTLLRTDARFRAFHDRRSTELPAFYAERFERLLGPYADLLTAEERVPRLPPPTYVPTGTGTADASGAPALNAASSR
jgi:radical SAM superfamily enzyme YgiQ (UPF0313 family)